MSAVVAAGCHETAEAAAEVLRAGGNAVDAAVAGSFAAFVAEPLLASAGGAGILTVALPDRPPAEVDFFSPAPGFGAPPDEPDFVAVPIDFGSATQTFHIGRASVAPPLALDGLTLASRRLGRLPLLDTLTPAIEMAQRGVRVGKEGALVYSLLWPIQAHSEATRALAGGGVPDEDTRLANPDLAALLEEVARHGGSPPSFDEALLRDFGPHAGGLLTRADLDAAVPRVGAPRRVDLGAWTVLTSTRPGGAALGAIVRRLIEDPSVLEEAAHVARVAEACRHGHAARTLDARGSTTHLSVIDHEGGAAAVTLTNGEGCGYVATGTGVQPNNFLGEEDLNPAGFHQHPAGDALPTMVAPTIATLRGTPRFVLGSGGSNRIRSVVAQVLHRLVQGEPLQDAVLRPRVHAEDDDVWVELTGRRAPDAIRA
ncbi:MAG: gamma-glutamyltransferase, partial [Sandaracinaceae bacterium]